jgi:aspartate/methionine/tyrosine aminotransferase
VLGDTAASVLRVEGGWYAVLRLPAVRSEDDWVLDLCEREAVVVQPGWLFDFEGGPYVVISLLVPEPALENAARRLARAVTRAATAG